LEKTGKQLLGTLLNEAQKELEALGVSDAGLNRLIYMARQEGALGAKLTGGGNGGCIIALARDEVHSRYLAEKLLKFGAQAVWPFKLQKSDDMNDDGVDRLRSNTIMKATAKAHTNIALIKYWGKRDDTLKLPMNNSLSLTLDALHTTTTVEFNPELEHDIFYLN